MAGCTCHCRVSFCSSPDALAQALAKLVRLDSELTSTVSLKSPASEDSRDPPLLKQCGAVVSPSASDSEHIFSFRTLSTFLDSESESQPLLPEATCVDGVRQLSAILTFWQIAVDIGDAENALDASMYSVF